MAEPNNILVTGGAGYVGSHACKALAQAGYIPVCYDNLSRGHEWAVKWGPFENGDILDRERLEKIIKQYAPLAVMHFAAHAYVGESVQEPAKYYLNNVTGALTLLDTMRCLGINNFIFSSTCAVYGLPQQEILAEDHARNPVNPYGMSKFMVEEILQDFDNAYDMKYIALRYFNAAGADADLDTGEDHDPETHLIPLAVEVALNKRPQLEIYGTDYPTTDGTAIRDYIHVSDIAGAHVLALEYLLNNQHSHCLNLGTGRGNSVREVVDTIAVINGGPFNAIETARRPGDPPRLVADAGRAQDILGWKPVYTDLKDIISTAWAWHKTL